MRFLLLKAFKKTFKGLLMALLQAACFKALQRPLKALSEKAFKGLEALIRLLRALCACGLRQSDGVSKGQAAAIQKTACDP